ncbi:unnamed protein product [Xylocopa violacea]|uniref:C2H2-type domain-containing protein n=1 Tax=Xylocopa violacea TaxID=135666 RepID=A0ABP1MVS8_XYLVO
MDRNRNKEASDAGGHVARPPVIVRGDKNDDIALIVEVPVPHSFRCPLCSMGNSNIGFLCLKDFRKHLEESHAGCQQQWVCGVCHASFSKCHAVLCHRPKCRGPPQPKVTLEHACDACGASFESKRGLSTHERKAHPDIRNEKRKDQATRRDVDHSAKLTVWTLDEIQALKEYLPLVEGCKQPNRELCKYIPGKTPKQIGEKRRQLFGSRSRTQILETNINDPDQAVVQESVQLFSEPGSPDQEQQQYPDEDDITTWKRMLTDSVIVSMDEQHDGGLAPARCCLRDICMKALEHPDQCQSNVDEFLDNCLVPSLWKPACPKKNMLATKKGSNRGRNIGMRAKRKQTLYARCQELYANSPRTLAEMIVNNEMSRVRPKAPLPDKSKTQLLYEQLWGTEGPCPPVKYKRSHKRLCETFPPITPAEALMPFFPNRTLESIKGQRRRAEHKGKVLEYIKELEAPPQDLAAVDQHQSTEAEPALVDGIKEALVALEPIEGTDFNAVHLNKICSNIKQWTNDKIFEETMSYLRSIFPPSPKDLRRIRKGASKVLTKRQERRAEYGRTQRAWRRSPFNCLRAILKGKNTANTPSQETMTNYWSTVMTNASAKSPGIEPSTRTLDALWKPIEPEEVKRAFPETTTSPGPDLVLSTRLMHSIDLDKRQKAFVPVDGCAENTFLFDMLLRHHRQTFKPLYLASVDIRKAFDSVTHQAILDALVSRGVPGPMVYRLLRSIPKEIGVDVSGEHHNALAFADDLVLVASTPQGLQQTLDLTTEYLAQCGLAINTGKSFTVAIRNVPHIKKSVVDSKVRFRCAGALLPAMRREDEWKYLGVPFTPEGRVTCNPEQQLQEAIAILSRAALKPQQRLFALRVMVLPSLYHVLTLGSTNLSRLKRVDNLVRGAARKWLALPHDVVNAYFHANAKDGGLSIPSMRWLMPLRRKERLEALAKGGSEPLSFLAQEIEKARRRLKDGRQELDHRDKIEKRWAKILHSSVDGKALNESRKVLTQNQWVLDGTRFLSGKDFINSVKLRINALPTKSRSNRGRQGDRLCRAGCNAIETLNHIMQICPRTHAARVARHNAIAAYVKRALAKNHKNVVEEPHIRTPSGLRKPDLVAMRDNTVLVIDAQVVSEQSDLARAHEAKKTYYRESIHRELAEKYNTSDIKYTSVTISCRGIWSKQSAEDLIDLKVLKKKDLKVLSSRALIGGLNAYWMFGKTTARRSKTPKIGVG